MWVQFPPPPYKLIIPNATSKYCQPRTGDYFRNLFVDNKIDRGKLRNIFEQEKMNLEGFQPRLILLPISFDPPQ